jgi:succinoglycan biosynthesis transport protein ExoP
LAPLFFDTMDPLRVQPPQEAKLHFLDYWRIIRIRKTVILAVFLLVVITATLVTFILPESYSSTARIKVDRDVPTVSFENGRTMNMGIDPYFIQTEFETIQSERVLAKVIQDLNLNEDWGKKYNGGPPLKTAETITLLKGKLDLRPVRNTSYIEIKVFSENRDEAARLANAIAGSYRDYRQEHLQSLSKEGIKALEARFEEQQVKVREAQTNVNQLRQDLKIPDSMANGDGPTMLMTAETLRKIAAMRLEDSEQYAKEETLLSSLTNLTKAQLEQALPGAVPDTLLSTLLQDRLAAQQRQVTLMKEFGAENPEIIKVNSLLEDLNRQVSDRVDGILLGLSEKVNSLKKGLEKIELEEKNALSNDIATARTSQPYFDAKHKLEELTRFSQALSMKIASESIEAAQPKGTMVELMDPAMPGNRPVRPNKPLNIALGIIIGLVVGVGLAFFIEYLDTSVKTIDDVERSLQSPVLGVIPQNVGLVVEEGVDSPHAEAYRVLRTNLLFSRKDDKLNSIAVVSAGAGEGKSTTVFNLAAVFAQSKHRVLIVDSDLRRPTLHKMMHVTNNLGLTNYLLKQNTLEQVIQTTSLPTLDFLASGKLPSSSLGILSSAQMRDLINELKRRYDFVFFDSPPIMGVSDASILASEVDMTLQVIQYRRYPQPMNIRAKQLIEKVGGNLVGIVLNNINMSQDESYYYYSGYNQDYYSRAEDQEPTAQPAGEGSITAAGESEQTNS